ncbi:hypothetical protein ACQ4PT_021109 [Festuca glaucescens]
MAILAHVPLLAWLPSFLARTVGPSAVPGHGGFPTNSRRPHTRPSLPLPAMATTSLAAASHHHILLPFRSSPSFNLRTPNRVRLCPAFPSILCASTSSASPQPTAGGEEDEADHGGRLSKQSSWEATDGQGDDYLYRLGKEAENMNIAVGARSGVIDDLFVGKFLGRDSDIVFDYRQKATRKFEYLQGDYYIAPAFLDKVAIHIVKNYLANNLNIKIPLILGVWGGKGQGKTFQTELIFKAMGVEPVIMSAGELESERAGEPGRLIRDRYRTASQVVQNQVRRCIHILNFVMCLSDSVFLRSD